MSSGSISFQRLIAIPQEEYLSLSNMQNIKEPFTQHYYDLEKQYSNEEKIRDPYRRLMMQSTTMDQLKQVKEQMRNSLVVSTPKPYQSRANALFQTVESFLKFNDKGEIETNAGDTVSGSRVEDLIQHAVRDRRRNMTPRGWTDFLAILREHNVPKSILNRDTLDEMERKVTLPTLKTKTESAEASPKVKDEPEGASMQISPIERPRLRPTKRRGRAPKDLDFLKKFKS